MSSTPLNNQKIAIVGAGISGLSCGELLSRSGADVFCFEKSRGPGGRMSTRRQASDQFDHGAQYFTARSLDFKTALESWFHSGVAKAWTGRFGRVDSKNRIHSIENPETIWVGTPKMSSITRFLSRSLNVSYSQTIVSSQHREEGWFLVSATGEQFGPFDVLVMSCPGPQVADILQPVPMPTVMMKYEPCWSLMLDYERPLHNHWDSLTFDLGPLSWAARDSSKPGRESGHRWVLHASPSWSDAHFKHDSTWVINALLEYFWKFSGRTPRSATAHRWRYARSLSASKEDSYFHAAHRLGICGDGFTAGRIESAWLSGVDLGRRILETL